MATIWIRYNFQIQKRIVPGETIWGNTVPFLSPHQLNKLKELSNVERLFGVFLHSINILCLQGKIQTATLYLQIKKQV